MSDGLQHCPACDEEYIAGVATCVECGGPLQSGPLERLERRERSLSRSPDTTASPSDPPSRLLARIPGLKADHAVRALLLEGIACRVDCQGVSRTYAPDEPPAEPFAVTLPVSIYVPDARFDAAQDLLNSFETDDVIGEQWSEAGATDVSLETDVIAAEPVADREPAEPTLEVEPAAESTSLRTVVLIVLVAVVLLFIFER